MNRKTPWRFKCSIKKAAEMLGISTESKATKELKKQIRVFKLGANEALTQQMAKDLWQKDDRIPKFASYNDRDR